MISRDAPRFADFSRAHLHLSSLEISQRYLEFFQDDPELRKYIEDRLVQGLLTSDGGEAQAIVILLHGIRTFGLWQHTVRHALGIVAPRIQVVPIRYGFIDIFKFLGPKSGRRSAITRVSRELHDAMRRNPGVPISIVAHSFGTYVVSEAIRRSNDIRLSRLQLCGSIIPEDFNWASIRLRIAGAVVNDVGTRDIWPLLAKHATTGYGPSGRFGFGSAAVIDRYFNHQHSDFFSRDHIENYWIPFLVDGQIVESPWTFNQPARGPVDSLLAWLPVKSILLVGLVAIALALKYFHH
jgi:hypothetical protein